MAKPRTFREIIQNLPESRRERVENLVEELTLDGIRRKAELSQADVADALDMTQSEVSKLERRKNLSVATLRRYLGAMGARLHLVAEFADGESVYIADSERPTSDGKLRKWARRRLPRRPRVDDE